MTITDFIGSPCDLSFSSLPSKREIVRFVAFTCMRLQKGSKFVSNKDIFNDSSHQLVSLFYEKLKNGFKLQLNHLL